MFLNEIMWGGDGITVMTAKSSICQASFFVDHLTKKINIFSTVRLLSNSLDLFRIYRVLKYNYEAKNGIPK